MNWATSIINGVNRYPAGCPVEDWANGERTNNPVLTPNDIVGGSVSTMGDECSPVGMEIGTMPKRAAGSGDEVTSPEEIVSGEELRCDQCGKIIPKTNQFKINYHGTHMVVCGKHYAHYIKFGKFLDSSQKTIQDSNEYEITDEGAWIYCFNKHGEPSGKFLIERCDLELVLSKKWRFWKGNYFTGNYRPVSISVWLMNPKEGEIVDHKNGNRADNRRSNLRVTTQAKNLLNKALLSNNHSGIAGVCWDKERKKWAPEIRMDGIKCHLGRFERIEDAVYVRYLAEQILFKEFRSDRNDKKILEYVSKCQRKEELKQYVEHKLSEKFSL